MCVYTHTHIYIYVWLYMYFRGISNDSPLKYRTDYILGPTTGDLGHRGAGKK